MVGELKSTSEGQTLVLTLSNPSYKNALSLDMYAAGIEALNAAENNSSLRSVILVGAGNTFCSGGNLQRLADNRLQSPDVQKASIDGLHSWVESIRAYPKPVIAAVEGAAAGAGFSLALACDFCVAADDAIFAMSYSKVALSPDGGASWHLSRALSRQLASELLMFGERLDASRLLELGLVNRLTAPGGALAEALRLAERLNALAPNALSSIKELLTEAQSASFSDHLNSECAHFVRNLHHPNAGLGIDAFLKKRSAVYR